MVGVNSPNHHATLRHLHTSQPVTYHWFTHSGILVPAWSAREFKVSQWAESTACEFELSNSQLVQTKSELHICACHCTCSSMTVSTHRARWGSERVDTICSNHPTQLFCLFRTPTLSKSLFFSPPKKKVTSYLSPGDVNKAAVSYLLCVCVLVCLAGSPSLLFCVKYASCPLLLVSGWQPRMVGLRRSLHLQQKQNQQAEKKQKPTVLLQHFCHCHTVLR